MAKRRQYGDGSVFKDKSRGGYIAHLNIDGKPVRRRAKTYMAAERRLKELQLLRDTGEMPVKAGRLSAALAEYAEVRRGQGKSIATLAKDGFFSATILSHFGDVRCDRITVQKVDQFLRDLASGESSPTGKPLRRDSVVRHKNYLTNVLNNQIRIGALQGNPAQVAVMPAIHADKHDKIALNRAQLDQLAAAGNERVQMLVELCGRYGLRTSEARALRWCDVDDMVVTVEHQMTDDRELSSPKTAKARRQIQLASPLAPINDSEFVLGGRVDAANLRRDLKAACKAAGVPPLAPTELRHSAITIMIDAGHSPLAVADWAGTSERMIAQTYRHRDDLLSPLLLPG